MQAISFKSLFLHGFVIGENQGSPSTFMFDRGFGTKIAFLMASVNILKIKQRIIKNTIYLTKSTKPIIVKAGCIFVGAFYYTGLFLLWHLPSFSIDLAIKIAYAQQTATTNYLLQNYVGDKILSNQRIQQIMKGHKVDIIK